MDRRSKLLDLAAEYRTEAARHRATADTLDERAALLESMAGEASEAVDIVEAERIIRTMDVNTEQAEALRRGVARARRTSRAQERLYQRGQTISGLAKELKEGRPRVSSWFADGDDFRPPPRRHAEAMRDKYGIPLSWWHRVGK